MLDDAGGVADDAGEEDFSAGEFHVAPDFEFMFVTDAASFINSSSVRLTRCESSTSVWQVPRDHPSRISPPTAVIRRAMPNCCDAGGVVEGTFARWRRGRGCRRVRAR